MTVAKSIFKSIFKGYSRGFAGGETTGPDQTNLLAYWPNSLISDGKLIARAPTSSHVTQQVKSSGFAGAGSATITGLLTTDTITASGPSDPTCSVNGTLTFPGPDCWDIWVHRAGAVWAYWPGINVGQAAELDASGNDHHLVGLVGTTITERADGSGTNWANEMGFVTTQNRLLNSNNFAESPWALTSAYAQTLSLLTPWPQTRTGSITLPDSSGGAVGKGFSCTGLAYDGTNFWVGNDGRDVEGDVTFAASLVKISPAGAKLDEILLSPLGITESVQGIGYDTSDDSIWCISTVDSKVYNITTVGAVASSFVVATVNGVTYDSIRDRLWCNAGSSLTRRAKDGTVEFTKTMLTTPDQIYHDPVRDWIWCVYGGNGEDGRALLYDITLDKFIGNAVMAEAKAIESCVIVGDVLYVTSDEYFHQVGSLNNQIHIFDLNPKIVDDAIDAKILTGFDSINNEACTRLILAHGETESASFYTMLTQALAIASGERTKAIDIRSNDENTYLVALRDTGTVGGYTTFSITPEWQTISVTHTTTNSALQVVIRGGYGTSNYADVLIKDAQMNDGTTVMPYVDTTTAAFAGRLALTTPSPLGVDGPFDGTVFPFGNFQAPLGRDFQLIPEFTNNASVDLAALVPTAKIRIGPRGMTVRSVDGSAEGQARDDRVVGA